MNRFLSLAVLGFAGLALAAPQASQAQTPVQVQPAPAGVVYVAPRYVAPAPVIVAPPVVVRRPVYYPVYRGGYRTFRYGYYRYHR